MAVSALESQNVGHTDSHLLPMERPVNHSSQEHIIDITSRSSVPSTSGSRGDHNVDPDSLQHSNRPLASSQALTSQSSSSSSTISNSRNASSRRRTDSYGRRHRSPLNSGLWISIELFITVGQIIASVVVLSLSNHENPRAPLFAWVVGYAVGCVATLPLLYWRYLHRNNQGTEQESSRIRQTSSQSNLSSELSYSATSVPRVTEEEGRRSRGTRWLVGLRTGTGIGTPSLRLATLIDHFKMGLDCFFAVWFVVGNVWIFGGHSSSSEAPNLYRLCIVFLTFSCIGYAMPFILCAAICCCLPCIISVLGFREDLGLTRGATLESINILPTYKFKSKRSRNRGETEINLEVAGEGGILAAGTDRERIISAEDAVCCICLAKYVDNDELRELPCMHFFHTECVDKWLKINASCPLCKSEVGESTGSISHPNSVRRQGERRTGNGATTDAYRSIIY